MTREEAWRRAKGYLYNSLSEEEADEIIKAIEQEPCGKDINVPATDAISRQAVLDINESHHGQMPNHINHQIWQEIKDLPSVNPQPKTGQWMEYTRALIPEPINRWEQAWYCSECGYGNQECEDGSAWLEWKYCPNCGAKMAESEVRE